MGHPPRVPILLGFNQGVIYFVTFCVEGRRHVLDNDDAFAAFCQAIPRLDWHIIAAVVMPDHVYWRGRVTGMLRLDRSPLR
jgi:hypothetical protein